MTFQDDNTKAKGRGRKKGDQSHRGNQLEPCLNLAKQSKTVFKRTFDLLEHFEKIPATSKKSLTISQKLQGLEEQARMIILDKAFKSLETGMDAREVAKNLIDLCAKFKARNEVHT